MSRERRCRTVRGSLAATAAAALATFGSGSTAMAAPRVFLLPEVSSLSAGESVEIEVFIENVTDLRLYEIVVEVAGGSSGSLDLTSLEIHETRGDFVFERFSSLVCLTDSDNKRITCSPLSGGCVTVTTPPAYLGTYTFTPSPNMSGSFHINIANEPTSFLIDCDGDPITPFSVAHSAVHDGTIPAVSEWGMVAMALLMLTAATVVLSRRQPTRA